MRIGSLFCGAGGFDLGMIRAGHKVVWANDIFSDACQTYARNIGNHVLCQNVEELSFIDLPPCDALIGGFPCQGFSVANMKRSSNDPRNRLYLEYLRALREIKPRYFFAENVRGILSLEGGRVFKKILEDFTQCGYIVQQLLLNASSYGVPQNRFRVIIFGVRKNLGCVPKLQIPPTHGKGLKPLLSIGKALERIPEPESRHKLKNHVYSQFQLKKNGYINHRLVDPSKPAPTVTARGDTKGGAMINHHPGNHRRLSVRETAIIQTFPKSFEFVGSMTSAYMQIGNAVPVLLAEKVGAFLSAVEEGKAERFNEEELQALLKRN